MDRMPRRGFLEWLIGLGGAVLAIFYGGSAFAALRPGSARVSRLQKIGPLSRFKPEQPTFAVYTGQGVEDGIFVVNHAAAVPTVFDFHCTHMQCAIQWFPSLKEFACPCHGSVFSIHGDVVHGPAPRPLHRHLAEVRQGELWVGGIDS